MVTSKVFSENIIERTMTFLVSVGGRKSPPPTKNEILWGHGLWLPHLNFLQCFHRKYILVEYPIFLYLLSKLPLFLAIDVTNLKYL
jgi:hypothetical protein